MTDEPSARTEFEGIPVVIFYRRVRTVRLYCLSDLTVKIVCPKKTDIDELLQKHREWILSHTEKRRAEYESLGIGDDEFVLEGRKYTAVCSPSVKKAAILDDGTFIFPDAKSAKKAVRKNLEARLDAGIKKYAAIMGVSDKIGMISIRNQKTRWASRSTSGTLSFNIKSAVLPDNLFEYLIVHELSHIFEQNHSKRFWAVVVKYCPDGLRLNKQMSKWWTICETSPCWKMILEN